MLRLYKNKKEVEDYVLKKTYISYFITFCEEKRRLDNENKGFRRGEMYNISN